MHEDLGSYAYVQRVYNANMRLAAYKLPRTAENGTVTLIADELINLTMQIENGRVKKITIIATNPRSSVYMQVFEGFEFGFNAVSTWIQNYVKSGTPPVAISLYSVTNTASVLPSTIEKTFAQPEALAPALLSLAKPYPQAFILGKSAVISL